MESFKWVSLRFISPKTGLDLVEMDSVKTIYVRKAITALYSLKDRSFHLYGHSLAIKYFPWLEDINTPIKCSISDLYIK